jgi:hypothetical protein
MKIRGSRTFGISSNLGLFSWYCPCPFRGNDIQKLLYKALACIAPQFNLQFNSIQSTSIFKLVSYIVNAVVKLMFNCAAP